MKIHTLVLGTCGNRNRICKKMTPWRTSFVCIYNYTLSNDTTNSSLSLSKLDSISCDTSSIIYLYMYILISFPSKFVIPTSKNGRNWPFSICNGCEPYFLSHWIHMLFREILLLYFYQECHRHHHRTSYHVTSLFLKIFDLHTNKLIHNLLV